MQLSDILATITAVNFYTTDTDPEEPWDNYRADGIMKNPFAIANGSWGAIIQAAAIAGGAVTRAKLESYATGSHKIIEQHSGSTTAGSMTPIGNPITIGRSGTLHSSITWAGGGGGGLYTGAIQVYRNGVALGVIHSMNNGVSRTDTEDLAGLVEGDVLQLYAYSTNASYTTSFTDWFLSCANPLTPQLN